MSTEAHAVLRRQLPDVKAVRDENGELLDFDEYAWLLQLEDWHKTMECYELKLLYEELLGEPVALIDNEIFINEKTGEGVRFFITESGRPYFDYITEPKGFVPFAHEHSETERFFVYQGKLRMILDGEVQYAGSDTTVDVLAGTVHKAYNDSSEQVRVLVSFPDAGIETWLNYYYEFFKTCNEGNLDEHGNPCMLEVLVRTAEFDLNTYPEGLPHQVVDVAKKMVARIKRNVQARKARKLAEQQQQDREDDPVLQTIETYRDAKRSLTVHNGGVEPDNPYFE